LKAKTTANPKTVAPKKPEVKAQIKKTVSKAIKPAAKKPAAKTVKVQPKKITQKTTAKEISAPKTRKKAELKPKAAKEIKSNKKLETTKVNSKKPVVKTVSKISKTKVKSITVPKKPVKKPEAEVLKTSTKVVKKPTAKKPLIQTEQPIKVSRKIVKTPVPTKNALLKSLIAESAKKAVPKISKKKISKLKAAPKIIVAEQNIEPQPRKKIIRAIGSAVFRGVDSQYDFKIYAINEIPKQEQAVYIISRRVTDHRKRGHHKLVCIGQTNSICESLKKHKKENCIKKHHANVICIMPEPDEQTRRKIEADLRAAHSIACDRL
jgi:hypothetical protein